MEHITFKEFADIYRLKLSERDGEKVIAGRDGLIYQYREQLAVCFMPISRSVYQWNKFRNKAVAIGMVLKQNGDSEGTFLFNPENREQSETAIAMAHCRRRPALSSAERAKRAGRVAIARQSRRDPDKSAQISV